MARDNTEISWTWHRTLTMKTLKSSTFLIDKSQGYQWSFCIFGWRTAHCLLGCNDHSKSSLQNHFDIEQFVLKFSFYCLIKTVYPFLPSRLSGTWSNRCHDEWKTFPPTLSRTVELLDRFLSKLGESPCLLSAGVLNPLSACGLLSPSLNYLGPWTRRRWCCWASPRCPRWSPRAWAARSPPPWPRPPPPAPAAGTSRSARAPPWGCSAWLKKDWWLYFSSCYHFQLPKISSILSSTLRSLLLLRMTAPMLSVSASVSGVLVSEWGSESPEVCLGRGWVLGAIRMRAM